MSLTKAEPIERATDEFRQVKHELTERLPNQVGINNWSVHKVIGYYYTVQRKWLVQDGEAYPVPFTSLPERNTDILVSPGSDGYFPWYAPVREEWRDLPTVTEAEAAQQP